jgi:signal transduction histidine kinase
MMRRLYLQLYLALAVVTIVSIVAAALGARVASERRDELPLFVRGAAQILADSLPSAEGPLLERELTHAGERIGADLAIWDSSGRLMARAGDSVPATLPRVERSGWFHVRGGHGVAVRLPDGRMLAAVSRESHGGGLGFLLGVVLFAGAMAAGCYPIARRITRRLETLQRAAQQWGAGDLDTRVPVMGKDEVAQLGATFNTAAERVSNLVQQQRRMLASASHELRSPLARLRMAIELLAETPGAEARARSVDEARRDIEELDALIEDLLLAARADAGMPPAVREPVPLFDVVCDEAKRAGATVAGRAITAYGDKRMLHRLMRNLFDNAQKHGGGSEVHASLTAASGRAIIVVEDRGPGVPEAEREKIFEPFYRPGGHSEGADSGVGLGLALVRQIAHHHGGRAWCEPRDGGGSRFIVELPVSPATMP